MGAKKQAAAIALPEAPAWLDELARLEWARQLSAIDARDVGLIDLALFEVYCQCFARWQAAEKHMQENGLEVVVRNDKGEVKAILPSPQVVIAEKSHKQASKARKECGLERALKQG